MGAETENFKVKVSRVSDASTELHEKNVYLALIVCTVLFVKICECVSLNVSPSDTVFDKD